MFNPELHLLELKYNTLRSTSLPETEQFYESNPSDFTKFKQRSFQILGQTLIDLGHWLQTLSQAKPTWANR